MQRRLSLNSAVTGTLLDETAARTGDPLLASIAQLFRYLTGDSHVSLDAVIDLADDATPAECVEALRGQVDRAIRAGGLPAELQRRLRQIVATIGSFAWNRAVQLVKRSSRAAVTPTDAARVESASSARLPVGPRSSVQSFT